MIYVEYYKECAVTDYILNKYQMYVLDRGQCFDVCHSVHFQCTTGVPCVLVDILYHGCSILRRKIL